MSTSFCFKGEGTALSLTGGVEAVCVWGGDCVSFTRREERKKAGV